jgi:hypothetical protein
MAELSTQDRIKFMKAGTLLKLDSIRRGERKPPVLSDKGRKRFAAILAEANAKKYGIIEANKKVKAFRNKQKGFDSEFFAAKKAFQSKYGIPKPKAKRGVTGMCGLGGVDPIF